MSVFPLFGRLHSHRFQMIVVYRDIRKPKVSPRFLRGEIKSDRLPMESRSLRRNKTLIVELLILR